MVGDLERAVEALYAAFKGYRPPAEGDFCEHCVRAEEVADLRGASLRGLTELQLFRYSLKAMGTWGGVEEFKYFLPRMLELVALGEGDFVRAVLGRVEDDWPAGEREAVRKFLQVWLREGLAEYPRAVSAGELVEIVAGMGLDLGFHLRQWERTADVRHLAELAVRPPGLGAPHDVTLWGWLGGPGLGNVLLEAAVEEGGADAALLDAALEAHDFWRDQAARW